MLQISLLKTSVHLNVRCVRNAVQWRIGDVQTPNYINLHVITCLNFIFKSFTLP